MARRHRLNTSIVLAAVHGLSGLFRAVSAVEPSLFRPLPAQPPSLISHLASVDVKQNGPRHLFCLFSRYKVPVEVLTRSDETQTVLCSCNRVFFDFHRVVHTDAPTRQSASENSTLLLCQRHLSSVSAPSPISRKFIPELTLHNNMHTDTGFKSGVSPNMFLNGSYIHTERELSLIHI